MNKIKKIKKTKVQLEHEIIELKAMLASTYHYSSMSVNKLTEDKCKGSGILVKLYRVGGAEASMPFFIRDGFSSETVHNLMEDMKRSYDLAVEFKPIRHWDK